MSLVAVRVVGALLLGLLAGGPIAVSTCALLCERGLLSNAPSGRHHASPNASAGAAVHDATAHDHDHVGHDANTSFSTAAFPTGSGNMIAAPGGVDNECVVRSIEAAVTSGRAAAPAAPVIWLTATVLVDPLLLPLQSRTLASLRASGDVGPPPLLVLRI